MAENKKPAIRFKGFTDAWEQRELGEIATEIIAGGDVDKSLLCEEGNCPVIANALTNDGIIGYYKNEYRVKAPAVTVTGRGDVGHAKARNDDFTPVVRLLSVKSEHDIYFLENAINAIKIVVESTGVPQLTVPQLSKNVVFYPNSAEEEMKIGTYFRNLDTLITLHQRKYDKLVKVKKSMLEKMFPKNGSKFPEIRFKGFTDAWEQRELKELASFAKGSGYSKNDVKEQGTPLILYGRLYTKYETKIDEVDTFAEPQKGSVYSQGCEVIVPASGETAEDIARASYVAKSGILLGGDLNIIYPNDTIEPTFLALSISNGEQQKNLAKKAQGKSVVHLHNSDLETVNIVYPTRTEQEKIGQYFEHLDNLITLHQRKLEKLKNIKKSMLQKMFL